MPHASHRFRSKKQKTGTGPKTAAQLSRKISRNPGMGRRAIGGAANGMVIQSFGLKVSQMRNRQK